VLSRLLTSILRHGSTSRGDPGITIYEGGFFKLRDIMNLKKCVELNVSAREIELAVECDEKQRLELSKLEAKQLKKLGLCKESKFNEFAVAPEGSNLEM